MLRGVSLHGGADEIVAVIGPNGAGKSTFLKAVAGIVRPTSGSVAFGGDDVTGSRPDRLTRRGLGFVPQLDNVFPTLTVAENLDVGAQALARRDRHDAVAAVVEQFPLLRERRRQRAGTLSGGQRKLVALGRALVGRPSLLLLDEPSAGLSPQATDMVFAELEGIRERGIGIVMVEQNARRALSLADRGYVLDMGRNAHEGTGADLLVDPRVAELYLGSMTAAPPPTRRATSRASDRGRPCGGPRSRAGRRPCPPGRSGRSRGRSRGRRSKERRSRSARRRASLRPCSFTCWMISKLRSTRSGASPIDGSSIRSSFGFDISARAIATICCSPPESVPASCARRSYSRGKRLYTRSKSSFSPFPCRYAPIWRFSSTLIGANRRRFSGTIAIPRAMRKLVFFVVMSSRSNSTRPALGLTMPRQVFSVVDLPDALPPSRQTSSPGYTLMRDIVEDVDLPVIRMNVFELEQRPLRCRSFGGRSLHYDAASSAPARRPRYASITLGLVATSSKSPPRS